MDLLERASQVSELTQRCHAALDDETTRHLQADVPLVTPDGADLGAFPVTLAFVGQYSAGKTTLINALTGTDLPTGAGVVTDRVEEVAWRGVRLVDTPGVETGTREEHDERAREAYRNSDLVVFVTTSGMLDPAGQALLSKLASDMGKARQMIFVVNKVSQDSATPDILRDEASAAVEAWGIEVVLCDALEHLEAERSEDPELRAELLDGTGISSLAQALTRLARESGTYGRLASPIQGCRPLLDRAAIALDNEVRALELAAGNLRDVIHAIQDAKEVFDSSSARALVDVRRHIVELADEPCDLILHGGTEDSADRLGRLLAEADSKVQAESEVQAARVDAALAALNEQLEASVQIESRAIDHSRVRLETPGQRLSHLLVRMGKEAIGGLSAGDTDLVSRVRLPTGVRPGEPLHTAVHAMKRRLHGSDVRPWSVVNTAKQIEGLAQIVNRFLDRAGPAVEGATKGATELGLDVLMAKFDERMRVRQARKLRAAYEGAADVAHGELEAFVEDVRQELLTQVGEIEEQIRVSEERASELETRKQQVVELSAASEALLAELVSSAGTNPRQP